MSRRRPPLAAVGEARLLAHLAAALAARAARPAGLAIGDDAAVLPPAGGAAVVASCDALVEDVDFRRQWSTPADLGHKAAAVNLSDLAAMGARPTALLAAVAAPPATSARALLALLVALDRVGRAFGAPLVGGDLSATAGPLVLSVTALGTAPPQRLLRRHAAHVGDAVLVSGTLGGAARGLVALRAGRAAPALVARQLRPRPQVALGQSLAARGLARAAADVSDGLAKDALHLVPVGAGVQLDLDRLPLAPPAPPAAPPASVPPPAPALAAPRRRPSPPPRWPTSARAAAVGAALHGGEDYELVVAVAPARVAAAQAAAARVGERLTVIGVVVDRPGLTLVGAAPPGAAFDHFG